MVGRFICQLYVQGICCLAFNVLSWTCRKMAQMNLEGLDWRGWTGGAGLEGGSVEFPFNGQAISQTWLFKEGM